MQSSIFMVCLLAVHLACSERNVQQTEREPNSPSQTLITPQVGCCLLRCFTAGNSDFYREEGAPLEHELQHRASGRDSKFSGFGELGGNYFYRRTVHLEIYAVHSPTNALFINLVNSFKFTLKYTIISLLHVSVFMTIIRELYLYLTEVKFMLKHLVKLRPYINQVMWQHVVERHVCCVLCRVRLQSGMCVLCCAE